VTFFRFAAFALAGLLGCAAPALGSSYAADLQSVAAQLDRVAKADAPVPPLHVPPAPLGGPPRYSPSVDDWLQSALAAARRQPTPKGRAAELRSIATALRFLASEAGAGVATSQPRQDPSAAARAILAQAAYRTAVTAPAAAPKETLWERILRWIGDKIGQAFDAVARVTQGVPLLGEVFAILLIGIAVGGLAFVAFRLANGLIAKRRIATEADGEALPVSASVDQLHAAALAAARSGNFARAVALLFQASLVLLDRSGRVPFDPSRTAGEYRRLVRRKAQFVARDFDALARIFTAAVYADEPIGEVDWSAASTAFSGLGRPLGTQ
jgi:hypothetical protein